jgi:hypothetical protein
MMISASQILQEYSKAQRTLGKGVAIGRELWSSVQRLSSCNITSIRIFWLVEDKGY